jgi:hypothetical protein
VANDVSATLLPMPQFGRVENKQDPACHQSTVRNLSQAANVADHRTHRSALLFLMMAYVILSDHSMMALGDHSIVSRVQRRLHATQNHLRLGLVERD